jgi:GDPmannose 4,6-dehydratase
MRKRALITGITGQDGCYLAKLLLQHGYEVIGLLDHSRLSSLWNLDYLGILPQIKLLTVRLDSYLDIQRLVLEVKPDEVYALAAQSSVSVSFQEPVLTMATNTNPVMNWLEAIRLLSPQIRFYQASSSEMYGDVEPPCVTTTTLFNPISPYAVSKVAAHHLVRAYRKAYGIYAVSGILFNHESVLRKVGFFTRKLMDGVLALADGSIQSLSFGNLDVRRDFGYSPDYVIPMWKMLQQDIPEDHLICTGESVLLSDIVKHVFNCMNVPLDAMFVDHNLYRPAEISDICGSPDYAAQRLGWRSSYNGLSTMERILEERLSMKARGKILPP